MTVSLLLRRRNERPPLKNATPMSRSRRFAEQHWPATKLFVEPDAERNRARRADQIANVFSRDCASVSALLSVERECHADLRFRSGKMHGNFAEAFVGPVVRAKTDVPDSHRTRNHVFCP